MQRKKLHLQLKSGNLHTRAEKHNTMKFKEAITTTLMLAVLTATTLLLSSNDHQDTIQDDDKKVPGNGYTCSPEVPASITFAGEKIDLTAQDRRERLDREILAFTYSHTNTLLIIKRANRLFPIIEPILKEYGVPDDFKYLMIIESNGDFEARSPAGAAGLWQFMESTGREFDLEVNKEIDERYHIVKATRAACRYLKLGYKRFGDWITVAASYNAGFGNISKRKSSQQQDKAIDMVLPAETSRYIFRLMAVKQVMSEPQKYGFSLRSSDLYPVIPVAKEIAIDSTEVNWVDFAKENEITYLQLREANHWIRSTTLKNKNGKSYKVAIPDINAIHYDPKKTKAHNPNWVVE